MVMSVAPAEKLKKTSSCGAMSTRPAGGGAAAVPFRVALAL
jgi:hypothetical protein